MATAAAADADLEDGHLQAPAAVPVNDQQHDTEDGATESGTATLHSLTPDATAPSTPNPNVLSSKAEAGPTTSGEPDTTKEEDNPSKVPVRPYSSFTPAVKWRIVVLVGMSAFFSPISSNIYFPAVPQIADTLGRSVESINLSITVFLIFQAIAPTVWGSLADVLGRRLIYLSTLAVYIASCIGLARTYDYWLLMFLRCIQAAGGSSVIAISQGTVGDIASPSERGKYFGFANLGPMSAPALGPVLGAVLAQQLGWHSIFWFLAIACGVVWLAVLFFLPETLRSIVGDGSQVRSRRYRPLMSVLRKSTPPPTADSSELPPKQTLKDVDLLGPIRILVEKDIACLLGFNSIVYGIYYSLLTSMSSEFQDGYGLTTLQTGLCFLPNGLGCMLASVLARQVFDRDFRIVAAHLAANAKTFEEKQIPKRRQDIRDLTYFPIEKARMRSLPFFFVIFGATSFTYGWLVQYRVHLAVPLVVTFFNGFAIMLLFNAVGLLAVDCFPERSSSSTASNNLARCLVGAAGTSAIKPMINAIGLGPSFSILLGVQVLSIIPAVLEWKCGMRWRQARARRLGKIK